MTPALLMISAGDTIPLLEVTHKKPHAAGDTPAAASIPPKGNPLGRNLQGYRPPLKGREVARGEKLPPSGNPLPPMVGAFRHLL